MQALGPGAFAFFHPHTGFAKGPLGGTYEEMLCVDLAGHAQPANTCMPPHADELALAACIPKCSMRLTSAERCLSRSDDRNLNPKQARMLADFALSVMTWAESAGSFHLVNSRAQRLRCQDYRPERFMIVPTSVDYFVSTLSRSFALLAAVCHELPRVHGNNPVAAV